jgi:hypothetical protein
MQDHLNIAVIAALCQIAAKVTEDEYGSWRIFCADGFALTATLENDWLRLRASFANDRIHGNAIPRCAWEVLLRNGLLPGGAKLVTAADRATVHAAVEFPLDREAISAVPIAGDAAPDALKAQLCQSIVDLRQAARRHSNSNDRAACRNSAHKTVDLPELCTAAGWPFNRRKDSRITVQLETSREFAQAIITGDDGVRATVELYRASKPLSASSHQAIAVLLLQLGGLSRAVRPAVCTDSGLHVPVLQASLGPNPSPWELDRILAALSVAAGMCQREIALLADEQISNRYLSMRGWSAGGQIPV